MSRYLRNQSVLAALETTNGTLATMAAADAILLKNVDVTLPDEGDPRNLMRGFMGNSEVLAGARRMELSFRTELAASGTLGTAPFIGRLLRACGMAETVTASTRVEYNPISTAFESMSFSFANDGAKYTGRFGRGTFKAHFEPYKAPYIDWQFKAIDTTGSVAANPSPTYSSIQRPQVVSDGNTSSLKTGASYSAGVVTGGTVLQWDAFDFDQGNTLEHVLLVGSAEAIDIADRNSKGSVSAFLDATNEIQWRTDWLANTLGAFTLQHGSVAGGKVILHGSNVQKHNIQPDKGGGNSSRIMNVADLEFIPTGSGNNDSVLVFI